MKKKHILRGITFLIGLSILLYPTISNQWNTYRNSRLTARYQETVSRMKEAQQKEMLQQAREYNRTLEGTSVPDVFAIRENTSDPEYEAILNPNGDGMMGYVDIPRIGVSIPIYHYSTMDVLEKGAGHIFGSSIPVGGRSTHTVISAHRGLPQAKMFRDLDLLKKGDLFYLQILGKTLAYKIDMIQVVEPYETRSLAITKEVDYATLVTCTPYAVNTHRLLVRGYRVTYEEETYKEEQEAKPGPKITSLLAQVLCVLLGVLIAVGVVFLMSIRERRKKAHRQGEKGQKKWHLPKRKKEKNLR